MGGIEKKVLEETQRFIGDLPELMKRYPAGRWVVYKDGAVSSDHDTEDEAYTTAVGEFGVSGGFVIAPVAAVSPTPVTAGVMFGLR